MAARKAPTKQQVKAARANLKKARAMMRAARKVLDINSRPKYRSRRHRLKLLSPAAAAFNTWQHDLDTLMFAVARMPGFADWTPEERADRATVVVDRMRVELDARRPRNARRDRSRLSDRATKWQQWESVFDDFVHELVSRSTLDANGVIDRAIVLADARFAAVKKRTAELKRQGVRLA